MRPLPWLMAERYRLPNVSGYRSRYSDGFGCFKIPGPMGKDLAVVATDGDWREVGLSSDYAWEHVSVSLPNRCPNWPEMDYVKSIFWRDDETVMQLHVPRSEHRNLHETCLHLWRPLNAEIPRPPPDTVAPTPETRE